MLIKQLLNALYALFHLDATIAFLINQMSVLFVLLDFTLTQMQHVQHALYSVKLAHLQQCA